MKNNSSILNFHSILSHEVQIGDLAIGGSHPVRIQSMTNTNTMDIMATVKQCIQLVNAGCELVRITAPGIKEAENLANIKKELKQYGIQIPLIADIHFNPKAAEVAARLVEKIRINPGNYIDSKQGKVNYSLAEHHFELQKIAERLTPLLKICQENGTAIRIGTNYGSLSERILATYGNTPLGMVESALEFVRICDDFGFKNLVLSMKASQVQIMIDANKLLVERMIEKGYYYPIHLGLTEAGNDMEGRIKSAAGIGTLLASGIGDTIRVSLTEDPEAEIPVAKRLVELNSRNNLAEKANFPQQIQGTLKESSQTAIRRYPGLPFDDLILRASVDFTLLKQKNNIEDIQITNNGQTNADLLNTLREGILQALRIRHFKTEFIACPSCGRTQFNLMHALQEVKNQTSHLKGLSIAVMGCIVNGPGEMVEADYGYVGSGQGKVTIFKGKTPVFKKVNEENAVATLIDLIKSSGDWVDVK